MSSILVSKTAPNAFPTLQEAILSVDDSHTDTVTIHVDSGIYEEKVFIRKENIEIIGRDPETTIFRFGDGARKLREDGGNEYGTFNTAVILLAGKDITMKNITIENTAGPGAAAGQALALFCGADRASFFNCRFIGYQDTIFAGEASGQRAKKLMLPDYFLNSKVSTDYPLLRNYFKDCYISGDVDFIFGPNAVYFDHCTIFSRKRLSEACSYITAASTPLGQEFGLVFSHCSLEGDDEKETVYLGRPWRDYAKTAFLHCTMGPHIHPEGWHNWGKAKAEANLNYVEYANCGPGAVSSKRAPFSKQLTNPELEEYSSPENVLGGDDGWIPKP